MERWWRERSARERAILGVGFVVLVVVVYGQLLLAPLSAAGDRAERRLQSVVSDLRAVEALAAQPAGGAAGAPAPVETNLRAAISEAAASAGLTITRMQPENDGGLTIWLEPAAPPAVLAFLGRLAQDRGVAATRVSIEPAGEQRVAAQATFAGAQP